MFRTSHAMLKCYKDCPRRYQFTYLDGLAPKFKVAKPEFTLGQHVHTTLKKLLDEVPQDKRTSEVAGKLLRQVWCTNRNGFENIEQEKQFGMRGLQMLDIFLKSNLQPQVLHLEHNISFDISSDIVLSGRVDRLDKDSSGAVHLIDYKTNNYNPEWIDGGQLRLYAVLVREGLKLPLVSASYWYLEQNQFVTYYPTDLEIEAVIDEVKLTVDRIQSDKLHPATPSHVCKWCEFYDICPAKTNSP